MTNAVHFALGSECCVSHALLYNHVCNACLPNPSKCLLMTSMLHTLLGSWMNACIKVPHPKSYSSGAPRARLSCRLPGRRTGLPLVGIADPKSPLTRCDFGDAYGMTLRTHKSLPEQVWLMQFLGCLNK